MDLVQPTTFTIVFQIETVMLLFRNCIFRNKLKSDIPICRPAADVRSCKRNIKPTDKSSVAIVFNRFCTKLFGNKFSMGEILCDLPHCTSNDKN